MLGVLEGIGNSFNGAQSGGKRVSLADVMILGGCAAVEQPAKNAGHDVEVPFAPGRTDAVREQTDVESCAGCFDDAGYFRSILELTAQRLEAVRGPRLTVLSSYMRRELIQVGIPADHVSGRQEPSVPVTCSWRTPRPVTVTATPGNELPFASTTAPSMAPVRWATAGATTHHDNSAAAMPSRTACRSVPRAEDVLPEVSRGSHGRALRSSTRRCSPMGE